MTPGESIARCWVAARPYLMARMWYAGHAAVDVARWFGVDTLDVQDAIREHGRRR